MNEWLVMSVLVAVLLLVAAHYLRRAVRTLRQTTPAFEMLPDERRFLRRQAWRRIVNSLLMIVLASLLVGSYSAGLQKRAEEIGRQREQAAVDGQKPPLTDEERAFGQLFGAVWIGMLLILGAILLFAALDLLATRSYALMMLRRIQSDRSAMLQRQLARWREERDGPSFD